MRRRPLQTDPRQWVVPEVPLLAAGVRVKPQVRSPTKRSYQATFKKESVERASSWCVLPVSQDSASLSSFSGAGDAARVRAPLGSFWKDKKCYPFCYAIFYFLIQFLLYLSH